MVSAPSRLALLLGTLLVGAGCGDLEANRICTSGPCPQQSAQCKTYVACYLATGGTPGSLDSTYGPNGTCWTSSAAATEACTASCASQIRFLRQGFPDAGC